MDAKRLAQIEEAVEVLAREGHEPIFVRELLTEVKRLRRSEGESSPPPLPITEQDGLPGIQ